MAKKHATPTIKAELNRDYQLLDNGALKIARHFHDLVTPYNPLDAIPDYLGAVDHSLEIGKKKFEKLVRQEEIELNRSVRKLRELKRFLIVVFQGRDASGKSGARKELEKALDNDAELFMPVPIKKPTEDELRHGYLWRFNIHERMPAAGQVRAFDRSWAERVLVEKVEEITPAEAIQNSYAELRAYEWLLVRQGGILVKFWMDISKKEQLKRFHDRAKEKDWKLTDDDLRARKKWKNYTAAANELFFRTGSDFAPQYIISSEDKPYSRLTVPQIINMHLRPIVAHLDDKKKK